MDQGELDNETNCEKMSNCETDWLGERAPPEYCKKESRKKVSKLLGK